MKKISALTLVLAAAAGILAAQEAPKKYDVKSGIVTLENVIMVGQMEIKMLFKVYFDDYGAKECKETYQNEILQKVYFSDGQTLYSLNLKKKIATNKGKAYGRGTELRVDLSEFGTKKDIESGKVKPAAPMQIAGKECEVIETQGADGVTRYAGWKKVMVYMKTGSTTIKALKIEENTTVPASKFQVPAGFTVQ